MSNDENQNIILRWFDALNKGDLQQLDKLADEFFAPDFAWHDPRSVDSEPGPEGVKQFMHRVLRENAAVQVAVDDIFSNGDKTAYRFTLSMTDVASGKPVNLQLLAIDRFVGGQIAEEWQLSAPGKW